MGTELADLAARFADAERQIRDLVARAPAGDRRTLLTRALAILAELTRQIAAAAIIGVEVAYAVAVGAAQLLTGRPVVLPDPAPVTALGGGLARRLTQAVRTAETNTREAIRTVTPVTIDAAADHAVTTPSGPREIDMLLGTLAEIQTTMIAERATSTGTRHGLGPDGLVRISTHGTINPICRPIEGRIVRADGDLPPYHAHCGHTADDHARALRNVRGEHLRQWYVDRYERQRRTAA